METRDSRVRIDEALEKVGGRFKLTVLIQKRVQELNKGAQRLVDSDSKNLIDVVVEEILADKIYLEADETVGTVGSVAPTPPLA